LFEEGGFFVELMRSAIRQNKQKSRATSQITLDDDCIVRDQKPDVVKIIHTEGSLLFEETKVAGRMAIASGQLKFTVLYRSEENQLEALSDAVRFTEKIYMEEVGELDAVKLSGRLEDLSITAINSRKLAVRAVVELVATCEQLTEEELVSEAAGDEAVQQRREKRRMLLLDISKRDLLRVHREFTLPAASPNIGRIIYDHVEIRKKEVIWSQEQLLLQGEAYVSVLYQSTEGTGEWYETTVPFSEMLDVTVAGEEPLYWVTSRLSDRELEAIGDGDGEMRSLGLDFAFDVDIKVWNEEDVEVLTDAYALDRSLIPRYVPMNCWRLLVKNEAQMRVSQQMKLPDDAERILQLCTCEGSVAVDQVEKRENALAVEGVLSVHILYATPDDNFPLAHVFEQIPFSQMIDVPGLAQQAQGAVWEVEPQIEQLAVNLLDHERYEIKASLQMAALVLQEEGFDRIEEIAEEPVDMELLSQQPGVIGYRVKAESLWDIAKAFHTTEAEIMETNALKSPVLQAGQKLVIVKKTDFL
jgi:hypothetical protein